MGYNVSALSKKLRADNCLGNEDNRLCFIHNQNTHFVGRHVR